MERIFPKEEEIPPIIQWFMAQDIEDVLSSRDGVVAFILEKFLEFRNEQSGMIFSDNLIERWMHFIAGYTDPTMPQILIDKKAKPTLYRLTRTFIYLPRVYHEEEKSKSGPVTISDSSGHMQVDFPERAYLDLSKRSGEPMDTKHLRETDWQSDVILVCQYNNDGDRYTLVKVLNRWAREPSQEEVRSLVSFFKVTEFFERDH